MFNARIPTMTINLPSDGLLGYPKEVELTGITYKEDLYLNNQALANVIDRLITDKAKFVDEQTKLDPDQLCTQDKLYILYMLRSVSYGDNYTVKLNCKKCKSTHDITVAISELPVVKLSKTYMKELSVKLPVSGCEVRMRVLPEGLITKASDLAKTASTEFGSNYAENFKLYSLAYRIESLSYEDETNGKVTITSDSEMAITSLKHILLQLSGKDIAVLEQTYAKVCDFGLNINAEVECPDCKASQEVVVSLANTEFFRPSKY